MTPIPCQRAAALAGYPRAISAKGSAAKRTAKSVWQIPEAGPTAKSASGQIPEVEPGTLPMTAVLAAAQVGAQLALLKQAPKRAVRSEAAVFHPVQIVLPARLLLRNLFQGPRRLRVALLAATLAAKLPWRLAA